MRDNFQLELIKEKFNKIQKQNSNVTILLVAISILLAVIAILALFKKEKDYDFDCDCYDDLFDEDDELFESDFETE